jgi:YVTN family beta-propeller protein
MKIHSRCGYANISINFLIFIFFPLSGAIDFGCSGGSHVVLPGRISDGRVLLPNGWYLSPAGKQVEVGDTPLNFDIDPSGEFAVVANNGEGDQTVSVVDLKSLSVTQTIPVRNSWLGIKFFENGKKFALSGGNDNRVFLYSFNRGNALLIDSIVVGKPWPDEKIWLGGLDLDEPAGVLYVTGRYDSSLNVIDLASKVRTKRIALHGVPYTCMVSHEHPWLYVSMWGDSAIVVFDRGSMSIVDRISVGPHPNDMVESKDGKRLFVANANENTVSVIDLERRKVTEVISSALFPDSPPGSTPNSVALSPDNKTLYIANADNNCLALFDISKAGESKSLGFIPTAWYPSCVRTNPATGEIISADIKGNTSLPNPQGPHPGKNNPHEQYIGSLFKGTLEVIQPPDQKTLTKYSEQAYANTPYRPAADSGGKNAVNASLLNRIKHVFYIIKENRTYDQVLGDMKEGNGDSSLALFGEKVTPNIHALARQFVLLDNFYVDAEVSADGHSWSMAAYATDYVEKTWPTHYGGHGGDYDFEGGNPVAAPSSGYIWENCKAHNVPYRIYGEFVNTPDTVGDEVKPTMASQVGHLSPTYRGWDLHYSDVDRVKAWEKELEAYEQNGSAAGGLPAFNVIYLPNDHTSGTAKGTPTPQAFVAQNDLALGMFIDRLSHSKYWNESAVFVIEDDAQNGPDHVDAHRSEALVISPFTKRHYVDHTMYSTSGMVHTMELILGLPPMTQYDASAQPMIYSFTTDGNFSPYVHLPNIIDLNERNLASAYGATESGQMNFSEADEINEQLLNEILWKSVKGANSDLPAPKRAAFVMGAAEKEK